MSFIGNLNVGEVEFSEVHILVTRNNWEVEIQLISVLVSTGRVETNGNSTGKSISKERFEI